MTKLEVQEEIGRGLEKDIVTHGFYLENKSVDEPRIVFLKKAKEFQFKFIVRFVIRSNKIVKIEPVFNLYHSGFTKLMVRLTSPATLHNSGEWLLTSIQLGQFLASNDGDRLSSVRASKDIIFNGQSVQNIVDNLYSFYFVNGALSIMNEMASVNDIDHICNDLGFREREPKKTTFFKSIPWQMLVGLIASQITSSGRYSVLKECYVGYCEALADEGIPHAKDLILFSQYF